MKLITYLTAFFASVVTVRADVCVDLASDSFELEPYVHHSATPKGGEQAGKYTHALSPSGQNITKLTDCLLSCCDVESCNVLFFHGNRCYLIACDEHLSDGCDPVYHEDNAKFDDTYMISVRTLQETHHLYPDDPDDRQPVLEECSMETNEGCPDNEKCTLVMDDDVISYLCVCTEGFVRTKNSGDCVKQPSRDLGCEYGLVNECFENEQCVLNHTRSKVGVCECVSGFTRSPELGTCVALTTDTNGDAEKTPQTSPTNPPEVPTQNIPAESVDKNTESSTTSTKSTVTTTATTSTATTPTTTTELLPLKVSVSGEKVITLPVNEISLQVTVTPSDRESFQYKWELVQQPELHEEDTTGKMVGMDSDNLRLTNLVAGLYTFRVQVSAEGEFGEAYVNVTVNPPERINTAPVAVIKPTTQSVRQPNDVVLDGAESHDDEKIVHYNWEQVSGPMETLGINDMDTDKAVLRLKSLSPGQYTFKLTVTDSDGVQNFTFCNVTVVKEIDYPPHADAGSNVIINLPENSATLFGNASTDDKGITNFEWIKNSDDKLTADMKGVRTPVLKLENLEQGDYMFTLKVTDTIGQQDTATVHVYVEAQANKPPVADAGYNQTLWLPQNLVTLDASNSTDDHHIDTYKWDKVSGPYCLIENSDRAVATASKLTAGIYKFRLVVTDDEKREGVATVFVTVKKDNNKPPTAVAGGAQVITLPKKLVTIDGRQSTDDRAIISWHWERDDSSLAAGDVINGSDHTAVLQLTNLVAGKYVFVLTVQDAAGLSDSDVAQLTVNPALNKNALLELRLDTSIHSFTEGNRKSLQSQIALLLHKSLPETEVIISDISEDLATRNLIVLFYVSQGRGRHLKVVPGPEASAMLKNRLFSDSSLLDFRPISIETFVCQNNCSGHGKCDQKTNKCICEAFWMQNPFQAFAQGESNCGWSILYVIIISFITLVTMIGVVWSMVFLCKRYYLRQPRKRHRYSLLSETDDNIEMKDSKKRRKRPYSRTDGSMGKIQNSSLMVSESDFSSEEETLFVNKKANGKNGFLRPGKNKVIA